MVSVAMNNAKVLLSQMESLPAQGSNSSSESVQKSLGYQGYQNKKQGKMFYQVFGE